MVANAIQSFPAQVERHQRYISTPNCMVVSAIYVGRQCIFTGMATGTMAAVVAQGDGFGESDIQPERASNRCGHLGYFKGVG